MPLASNLHYFVHNEGTMREPPVLLIHGAGGDYLHWPPQIRRLPFGRIYTVDLPGHGHSGLLGCQLIEDYARALIQLLDALNLPSVIAVGHSMGGAIALQMALSYPQRILGLGLVSTGAHLPVSEQLLNMLAHEETSAAGLDFVIKWAFSPATDKNLRNLARRRMSAVRPTVLHGDFAACNDWDVRHRLGEIQCPALILAGTADKMTPLRLTEGLKKGLPRAEMQTFVDAGHMLMLERPVEVAQALTDWLKKQPYRLGT